MALAAYLNPGGDLAATIDCVKLSETLGYDSVWVTHGLGRDSFLVLAAYAAATSRIGLGNGVVPIYPRHPAAMNLVVDLTYGWLDPRVRVQRP